MKKSSKSSPKSAPRRNKSKEELRAQMASQAKLERNKTLARLMWPILESQKTIYDAQTVCNALSGFIEAGMRAKLEEMAVTDILIDLSKEKDTDVKRGVEDLRTLLQAENAQNASELLQTFGKYFTLFGARKYLENPMTVIKMEDFIA